MRAGGKEAVAPRLQTAYPRPVTTAAPDDRFGGVPTVVVGPSEPKADARAAAWGTGPRMGFAAAGARRTGFAPEETLDALLASAAAATAEAFV